MPESNFRKRYDIDTTVPVETAAAEWEKLTGVQGTVRGNDAVSLTSEGFEAYRPTGRVWAKLVTKEDMQQWFPKQKFIASWGEPMAVEENDMIAVPWPNGGEIYRIEQIAFQQTYAPVTTSSPVPAEDESAASEDIEGPDITADEPAPAVPAESPSAEVTPPPPDTAAEKPALVVTPAEPPDPEAIPPRFISATKGDMKKAKARWEDTKAWREQNGVDSILAQPHPNFDKIKVVSVVWTWIKHISHTHVPTV